MLYPFAPTNVDYIEVPQALSLKPGSNTIGDVTLILSSDGRVLKIKKTERQNTRKVFGFKNRRVFLGNIAPFLSSLSLCFFFFWYAHQQKNRYVLFLKQLILGIFLLVSLWSLYWALVPKVDPISDTLYYIGTRALHML